MTPSETAAFNRGIEAVAAIADQAADALRRKLVDKPTRYNFAIAALDAVAHEAKTLTIPITMVNTTDQ